MTRDAARDIAVDTSALIAIVLAEDDADTFVNALMRHRGSCFLSAATWTESLIVSEGRGGTECVRDLRELHAIANLTVVPVDSYSSEMAFEAWRQFGKGNHPARLNLGDCFSYALARSEDLPLLFKGDDFSQTDIVSAL